MHFAKSVPVLVVLVGLASLTGCGPSAPHPMDQRAIDQCIAGLGSMIPETSDRKKACECASAVMQADRIYRGERNAAYDDEYDRKIQACGVKAGMSKSDPFGILDDDNAGDKRQSLSGNPEDRNAAAVTDDSSEEAGSGDDQSMKNY